MKVARNFSEEDLWKTRDIIVRERNLVRSTQGTEIIADIVVTRNVSALECREKPSRWVGPKSQMEILHNSPLHIHHHFVIVVVRSCLLRDLQSPSILHHSYHLSMNHCFTNI